MFKNVDENLQTLRRMETKLLIHSPQDKRVGGTLSGTKRKREQEVSSEDPTSDFPPQN